MMDYHVHTMLCRHARGTMEQYVDHAVRAGLAEICFLDHLTLNQKGRDLSMAPRDVPLYYYAARRLQAAYNGQIKVKVGLEVDFTPAYAQKARTVVERFDFDVIGGSVHFIEDRNLVSSKSNRHRQNVPDPEIYQSYLDLLDRMLDYSYIDVVCHLDMIKKFGTVPPDGFYEKLSQILDKIASTGRVLEINTSGQAHPVGAIYPDARILGQCREKNIPLCLGSDAHQPDQVGRGFSAATELIQKAGYRRITGFDRKNPYEVPLRDAPGGKK